MGPVRQVWGESASPAAQAGWGQHASTLLCKPSKERPRPSLLRRHLSLSPPPPVQPKGIFPSAGEINALRPPLKGSGVHTGALKHHSSDASQRNDSKPVLLQVGSSPKGFPREEPAGKGQGKPQNSAAGPGRHLGLLHPINWVMEPGWECRKIVQHVN